MTRTLIEFEHQTMATQIVRREEFIFVGIKDFACPTDMHREVIKRLKHLRGKGVNYAVN
jgi:hypothetical protein